MERIKAAITELISALSEFVDRDYTQSELKRVLAEIREKREEIRSMNLALIERDKKIIALNKEVNSLKGQIAKFTGEYKEGVRQIEID